MRIRTLISPMWRQKMEKALLAELLVPTHVWISLGVIALAVGLMWYLLRRAARRSSIRRRGPRGGEAALGRYPPTSLAALLARPLPLDEEMVTDAVHKAWGARPTRNEADQVSFVQNPTPVVTSVQIHGSVFAIISMPEPYTLDRDWYVRDETPSDLITAWQQHKAWLSIDVVSAAPDARSEDLYDRIGKLLAQLVAADPDGGLAVFRPGKRHAIVYDDETRTLLRRTSPHHVVTGPLTSLVLLLKSPRRVETLELLMLIKRAWGAEIGSDPVLANFAAAPKPPYGFIQFEGIRFGLITPETSYVQDLAGATSQIADVRLRDAVAQHKAWLSVDMVEAPVRVPRTHVYSLIARLIAELIDERALLVFCPELNRAVPITPDLAGKLRGEDPLRMLAHAAHPPILNIDLGDPRMAAAVDEARRRLPEFVAAFSRRKRQQRFAVKKRFADGPHSEFMWIRLTGITLADGAEGERATFTGILDNQPYQVKNVRLGETVLCRSDEVVDWLYTDAGAVTGNFTGVVLAAT